MQPILCRWLGVAGLEFKVDGFTLLIDPFFTRPGKAAVIAGARVRANKELSTRYAPNADAVLITHPHYDHLMDVPDILRRTSAPAYGSPNVCKLLELQDIAEKYLTCLKVGDRFQVGPFAVEVFPARHTRIPFSRWLNGPLPAHLLKKRGSAPARQLRLSDYRMDTCFSFRIQVSGQALLVGNHPVAVDGLFLSPYHAGSYMETLLRTGHPRWIVPIHWEDFMRPLTRPLRPMLLTPAQGLKPTFPPVGRIDLDEFARQAARILPGTNVIVPEIFKEFELPSGPG